MTNTTPSRPSRPQQPPNPFDQQKPIPNVKNIVAVASGKGGVGKSTVASNLALALHRSGAKVGLLDADIYGPSVPRMWGALNQRPEVTEDRRIQPIVRHGVKLMSIGFLIEENSAVVWRGPMLFKALDQFFRDVEWGELDYLIIDLPPGTGDIHLSLAQKVPVTGVVCVTTPQNVALVDVKKALDMFERVSVPVIGMVENMSYMLAPGTNEKIQMFPKGDLDRYLDQKQMEKLGELPFNPGISMSGEIGIPFVQTSASSPESAAFASIAEKIRKRLG